MRFHFLLLLALFCVIGCSNSPGNKELSNQVLPAINGRLLSGVIEAESITKKNGQEIDVNTYVLYFECNMLIKGSSEKSNNESRKSDDGDLFATSGKGEMDVETALKFFPTMGVMMLANAVEAQKNGREITAEYSLRPGTKVAIPSSATFVKTENGWVLVPESISLFQ